jgi:hypothetical protein
MEYSINSIKKIKANLNYALEQMEQINKKNLCGADKARLEEIKCCLNRSKDYIDKVVI